MKQFGEKRAARTVWRSLFVWALAYSIYGAETAMADSIRGYVDLDYSNFTVKSRDSSGQTTETNSQTFRQRYHLTFNKTIYPNLFLNAGGIFNKDWTLSEVGDSETTIRSRQIRPFADLTLRTPLYNAGILYNRREQREKFSGSDPVTNVNEEYDAILGWRPSGLPSFDMRYERTNTYDTERVLRDITRDRLLFNVIYNNSGLDVRYQGIYDQNNNKLAQLKIRELTHNGIFSYSSTFFKNRVSVYASYNISRTDTKTVASRSGEVRSQQFPFSGLSSLDDSPAMGTLDPNPALIDGAVSIGSGVNIGLPPVAGDTRPRNIGVDFFSETEVNTLLIWIDRELPDDIAASFTWDIYTSADNIMWNLESTVAPAPFGPFENRFEIDFSTVNSRYIKVVTRPLAATVVGSAAFPNILVTEIQAFIRKPVEDVEGRTSRTSQIANLDIRTRLLDTPMVFHEFSYYLSKREPFSQTRWTLSNGLSITHRFNRVFSSSARVAREDVAEEDERGVNYTYNATVRAEPLDTLSHTLLLSRRNESIGDETIDRDSIFLQNTASLYKGIDVFLHGGVSSTRQGTGQKQESLIVTSGANFIPHETLTVNVNYTDTTTNRSGGGGPEGLLVNRRGDVGVSFRPFQTVYLFGSLSHVTQEDRIYMLNNYAVNWSPFPYGALQFNFAYNEEFRTENNEKLRNISPSLRWNITNRIFLNVSYQMIRSQSNQQTSDIRVFNANVKMRY